MHFYKRVAMGTGMAHCGNDILLARQHRFFVSPAGMPPAGEAHNSDGGSVILAFVDHFCRTCGRPPGYGDRGTFRPIPRGTSNDSPDSFPSCPYPAFACPWN